MEKILICSPTAKQKNYCAEAWLKNLQNLTYPDFEVVVFDNTNDGGANANYLNYLAQELCLSIDFKAVHVGGLSGMELLGRITESHNYCRMYALEMGYKHMLHLETDVFPEKDVIERLLAHRKKVVGGLYYRDEGKSRKLMIQRHVHRAANNILATNVGPEEDVCFIDGKIKKVAHVGLGCVMLDTRIFKSIKFRFRPGIDASADTYFAEDCFKFGFGIWADTSLICQHRNQAWGNFGVDYN